MARVNKKRQNKVKRERKMKEPSSGLALGFTLASSTILNPKRRGQVRVSRRTCQSNSHINTQGRVKKDLRREITK